MQNIREKINPVVKIRQRLWHALQSKSNFYYGVKPTLNDVLSFFLLIAIAVSIVQTARAESIGEFLEELLQPAAQNDNPLPPTPAVLTADKSAYAPSDTIRISNTPRGSAIEIYWLDNPDTALNPDPDSRPSNVYATFVNDDGTVNIDTATLPPGKFVFVNTFEPGYCGGLYLSQCRQNNDYLGEVLLTINP